MTSQPQLTGCSVLVLEDEYHVATDVVDRLRRAGATVMGPVSSTEDALALFSVALPGCALLDINLGQGPDFTVADALQGHGVPFAFVTGYTEIMIPDRFAGVSRVEKPVDYRDLMRTAANLCAACKQAG